MSHFTHMKTRFQNLFYLEKALAKLEIPNFKDTELAQTTSLVLPQGENSNVRFAGSKTITRPVIMEAYPLEFVNPDGTIEQGNTNIKNSENINFDLKHTVFSYIPNTAETAFLGMMEGMDEYLVTKRKEIILEGKPHIDSLDEIIIH